MAEDLSDDQRRAIERTFLIALIAVAVVLASVPVIYALLSRPTGSSYIGSVFGTDDQMVYAAWMRQAMDGRLLMDNRFTIAPQPSLTVHVYFFALGLVAKLVGIPTAANLARLVFGGAFLALLYRLVRRLSTNVYCTKLALTLSLVGGGLGFLVWHNFGVAIVKPEPSFLTAAMLGKLPTDIWQPEGFVLPSMLTSSLFMVSLCLIVYVLQCVVDAREDWRKVAPGAVAFGVLMNIHSYDVLLVGIILVGLLISSLVQKQFRAVWLARVLVIIAGVIPAALWFVYVLRNDPVFQARAATETFSPNFRQVFFGYLPMVVLGVIGFLGKLRTEKGLPPRALAGLAGFVLLWGCLFFAAANAGDRYFMGAPAWVATFVFSLGIVACWSTESPTWNLLLSWAVLGSVAIYFPALFQRKLAMGLSIPWAVASAYGIEWLLQKQDRSLRNLATVLAVIVLGGTSVYWIVREKKLIDLDVSNTTVQPVYLNSDVQNILRYLNQQSGRVVAIAPTGVPSVEIDPTTEKPAPDSFLTPIVPDLNPVLSGLAGVYTYAGHWSETPDYLSRRADLQRIFFGRISDSDRVSLLRETEAQYVVAPVLEAFPNAKLYDFKQLGDVVVDGNQFRLVHLRQDATEGVLGSEK